MSARSKLTAKHMLQEIAALLSASLAVKIKAETIRAAKYSDPKSTLALWEALFAAVHLLSGTPNDKRRPYSKRVNGALVSWLWWHGYRRPYLFKKSTRNITSRELLLALCWLVAQHTTIFLPPLSFAIDNTTQLVAALRSPFAFTPSSSFHSRSSDISSLRVRNSQGAAGKEQLVVCRLREVVAVLHRLKQAIKEHSTLIQAALNLQYEKKKHPTHRHDKKNSFSAQNAFSAGTIPAPTSQLKVLASKTSEIIRAVESFRSSVPSLCMWWSWCASVVHKAHEEALQAPACHPIPAVVTYPGRGRTANDKGDCCKHRKVDLREAVERLLALLHADVPADPAVTLARLKRSQHHEQQAQQQLKTHYAMVEV